MKSVKAEVIWISSLPMSESQQKNIAPLLKVSQSEGGLFGGELVKQVGRALKQDVKDVLPFVVEGAKQPKGVPQYHELINAAMYAYRNYRDEESYAKAIRYLAEGIREEVWDPNLRKLVSHYRRYGYREIIGNSIQIKELRERINFVAANPDARVLVLGESGTGKEKNAERLAKENSFLRQYWQDIKTSFALLKDWCMVNYTKIPFRMVASIAGAMLYLVSSLDVVPDWVPFGGLLDDAIVLAAIFALSRSDLDAYTIWAGRQK